MDDTFPPKRSESEGVVAAILCCRFRSDLQPEPRPEQNREPPMSRFHPAGAAGCRKPPPVWLRRRGRGGRPGAPPARSFRCWCYSTGHDSGCIKSRVFIDEWAKEPPQLELYSYRISSLEGAPGGKNSGPSVHRRPDPARPGSARPGPARRLYRLESPVWCPLPAAERMLMLLEGVRQLYGANASLPNGPSRGGNR